MYEYTFLASWLKGNDIHMSNALVFACDFKFWLNCRTILLFCGTILFGTIWPWNKDSDRIPDTDIHQSIILWRHSSSVCLLVSQYVGQHPFFFSYYFNLYVEDSIKCSGILMVIKQMLDCVHLSFTSILLNDCSISILCSLFWIPFCPGKADHWAYFF